MGKEGLCKVDDTSAAPPSAHTTEDLLCEVAAAEPRRPGAGAERSLLLFRGLNGVIVSWTVWTVWRNCGGLD